MLQTTLIIEELLAEIQTLKNELPEIKKAHRSMEKTREDLISLSSRLSQVGANKRIKKSSKGCKKEV